MRASTGPKMRYVELMWTLWRTKKDALAALMSCASGDSAAWLYPVPNVLVCRKHAPCISVVMDISITSPASWALYFRDEGLEFGVHS
jgi:hypothetical protein